MKRTTISEKRIVAVIPARAGSKAIPNKNIRLINKKPLVYYAIHTALQSKWISEIIVTTDSKEIQVIAKQMGVKFIDRDSKLAEDDVTLDSVIYDAVKHIDADYVVTMQPTSPLLNYISLDAAIETCIKDDIDTCISVTNRPHLSWRLENGHYYPNYQERLNRQYLPANYVENGAFMITKRECVNERSRIGSTIGVFELSENEGIDIDSFADLKYAEMILQQDKVAFYVNGNNKRGVGHVYRALELADEFYCRPDIYYDINQTDVTVFGNTTHHLIGVNGINELFRILEEKKYSIFINDILDTSIDYMIGLRSILGNAKIINFEDVGEGNLKADLVFNALYCESSLAHIKTGEKYYIASKLFLMYEPIKIHRNVKNVFIAFGGADPQNYTDRLLSLISGDEYASINFHVVLGREKENVERLMEYDKTSNISVFHDISNMPEIMSQCDFAITSRGRTGYELALLGIPSIAMAQNSREEKHGFVSEEHGFIYLGLNPSDYIIKANIDMMIKSSEQERKHFQKKLLECDLKKGRRRVISLINSI